MIEETEKLNSKESSSNDERESSKEKKGLLCLLGQEEDQLETCLVGEEDAVTSTYLVSSMSETVDLCGDLMDSVLKLMNDFKIVKKKHSFSIAK